MLPIGGAGPVHACSMARKMNIERIDLPARGRRGIRDRHVGLCNFF